MRNKQIERQILDRYTPIKITDYAIKKANVISKRMCELAGESLEVSFCLLDDDPSAEDMLIGDVYISQDQRVTPAYCDVSGSGGIRSMRDIKYNLKKRIVGWGHSHANFDVFYSGTDDATILNRASKWKVKKEVDCLESILEDVGVLEENGSRVLRLDLEGRSVVLKMDMFRDHSDEYNLRGLDVLGSKKRDVGVFYGMTFNALGADPYCVLAYTSEDGGFFVKGVEHKVVENSEREVDVKEVDRQLKERVINLREIYEKESRIFERYKELQSGCEEDMIALMSGGDLDSLNELVDKIDEMSSIYRSDGDFGSEMTEMRIKLAEKLEGSLERIRTVNLELEDESLTEKVKNRLFSRGVDSKIGNLLQYVEGVKDGR
tara:strand:+ start:416 stop:1543 length:1128 start_codon:yes stop_codon:yes gene_type:complete